MTISTPVTIYVDGGSRGNPGPAGAGAVISSGSKEICSISQFIGIATNNIAEYTGLVLALEKALELGLTHVQVYMDSELVVKQMNGQYRVKNAGLLPLFQKSRQFASQFASFKIDHVRRESNKVADRLANQAMDTGIRETY